MSYSVFNTNKVDQLKQPMFFGENVNVSRYDQQRYKEFEDLIEKQLSFFWRPDEIDVSKDRLDFQTLPEHEKHIFLSNLKYQTLLDSVQGRSPNVAFLPIVSIPELETWIETWAFSECLAEGTEVLTQDGWKDLADTSVEDSCAVYDLKDDSVHFEKPKRVVEYDVDTDMVCYESGNKKQFSQMVTPNHRMPVIHRDKRKDGTQNRYFKEAMFQNYQSNHLAPVSGFLKAGKGITDHERLLIAIQADGTISDRYTGERCGTLPVWFSFSKERKILRLKELCMKLKYELVELSGAEGRSGSIKDQLRFKVNVPVTKVLSKTFDWVSLSSVSLGWCEDFLEELSYWDSHKTKKAFTYSSVEKSNVDVVQAVSSLCGKHARLTVREDGRKTSHKDIYSVNVVDKQTKDGQSIEAKYTPYKGKVRCLETSTGAFIIRYNGVVSVTGNTIHSRSYTHIVRNIMSDPSKVFDDIISDEEILKRAASVSHYYDNLIKDVRTYEDGKKGLYEVKKSLYLCMMSVNILEAIRFYVSFACSFAFAERKLMEGNAKIIKLIARDESLHHMGTQKILKNWSRGKDDPDMVKIAEECREEAIEMFIDAAEQEKEWAEYLFKDGSMIGLNKDILCQYVEYITNSRMKSVGLGKAFENANKNPIPWINSWLVSDNVQVAPQETEISSYLIGQIDSQVDVSKYSSFEL